MFLKKLEIYGFKSFADRVVLEFDKGITCIVGPNGSGKSNVADAVRWVLGEQSAKSLRGVKMEDVIFAGTQVRKPLGFAEVSLTLDNSDGSLPLDYTEVTVTRRVYRSGESEYYINRSSYRLKDIIEMFMDTGIGKEGYSIIGQGRIDELLSTKAEDRRYIFEEAAGIVKYKARKEESQRKLEKTEENLVRVKDILSELENQLVPLEKQAEIAREFLKLREQLKFYEINQFILQYRRYSEKIADMKDQVALLETDINRHRDLLAGCQSQQKQIRQDLLKLEEEAGALREKYHGTLRKIEGMKGEIAVIQEKVQQLSRENQRLKNEMEALKALAAERSQEMDILEKEMDRKQTGLERSRALLTELKQQFDEIQNTLQANQEAIERKKEDAIEILNRIADRKNKLASLRTMKTSLLGRRDQIHRLKDEKSQQLEDCIKKRRDAEDAKQELEHKIDSLKSQRTALLEEINKKKETITNWENHIQQKSREAEGKKSRLNVLKDMKDGYEGFNKSVREILKACRQNEDLRARVCGVVADLIKVPREYETAIETALGSSMQHIVTPLEEDAKRIIEFLRENNFGRATFLPMSSVKGRSLDEREKAVLKMTGCIGTADTLIQFDPKYRDIFQYLLGRVVIAEKLDQAIQMARRFSYAFRIVTLEGDVMNPGGSMTGGSNGNRGISLIGRNREIQELQKELEKLNGYLAKQQEEKEKLLRDYVENKKQLESLEGLLHELDIKWASEKEKVENLDKQYESIKKEQESLHSELLGLEQDLNELSRSIETEEMQIRDLEEKNSSAQEMAENVEVNLKNMIREKEELNTRITEVRIEVATMEKEIHSLKDRFERLRGEYIRCQESSKGKEKQIQENDASGKKLEKEIADKLADIDKHRETIHQLDEEIRFRETEKKVKEDRFNELEQRTRELGQTVDELTDRKYKFQIQLSKLEAELDHLQNNIWEEYEISYQNALSYFDEGISLTKANQEIQNLKGRIQSLGEVNVNAIEELKRVKERYDFLQAQKNDLINAKEDLKEIIKDITKTMEEKFREEFAIINQHFKEVFSRLFGGGNAELILEDQENVLECGIKIVAQPPGKKLQNLSLLSGGEKALTAIAILFAILRRKPTPFCILDEIEAALDEHNLYHFGSYLKEFAKDTQFIVITHRKGTMEFSDAMYGVAMEEKGVSKLVSVKLEDRARGELAFQTEQ